MMNNHQNAEEISYGVKTSRGTLIRTFDNITAANEYVEDRKDVALTIIKITRTIEEIA